ncbi:hypothetical protein [uncultured Desulfobacter sp.]|uniref:hypothetical protein n=1 Tax=uncultured Desulfobacter sp. TaxID=240139 RepID=UPI0029F53914|nr:hypothetical protein [uncultured Desulfobacter sp.]
MASKFRIYSTEVSATVDPDNAAITPGTLIAFDQDPLFGEYDPDGSEQDRGTVIRTLGGVVVQDFGVVEQDGEITLSDTDALEAGTVMALKTAYAVVDGQYYFTDGYECWKVQFSRNPRGLKTFRNILAAYHGTHLFSYEIRLQVISKEI